MTDAHTRHPHSRLWGNGTTASSDGQFFRASDRAAKRGDVNLHYGSEPGSKFYSHLSDQYGYFSILPISPTESEAAYVLDGLFDQEHDPGHPGALYRYRWRERSRLRAVRPDRQALRAPTAQSQGRMRHQRDLAEAARALVRVQRLVQHTSSPRAAFASTMRPASKR